MYLVGLDFKFNQLDEEDKKIICEALKIDLTAEMKGLKSEVSNMEELVKTLVILTKSLPDLTFFVSCVKDHCEEGLKDTDESL